MTLYAADVKAQNDRSYIKNSIIPGAYVVEGNDVDDVCEQIASSSDHLRFIRLPHETIENPGEERGDVLVLYHPCFAIQDITLYIREGPKALLKFEHGMPHYFTIGVKELKVSRGEPCSVGRYIYNNGF